MKKIVGIGEIVWDMLPAGKQLGGAPVNFVYFAKQLGADAVPVSAVGSDELGEETVCKLTDAGLNPRLIQRNGLPTSRVLITLDSHGIPNYEIVEGVAWDAIEYTDEAAQAVSKADAICWGSLAQRSEKSRSAILKLIDRAKEDCLKVFDINIRQHYYSKDTICESLKRADILKLNEDELPLVSDILGLDGSDEQKIHSLIVDWSLQSVIFTQGARCSEIFGRDGLMSHIDTPRVKVTDTVGAGDSFTAAYITCRMNGKSVTEAHGTAVRISAFVCTMNGAINPLPKGLGD